MRIHNIVETLRHGEAFEFYYWLGDARTLSQVARQFKVTPTAAAQWSQAFRWAERIRERDAKFIEKMQKRADAEAISVKERQLKIMRATQHRYAARLLSTEQERAMHGVTQFEPTGVDAVRAAQHELLLTGQVTGRTELTVGQATVDSFVAAMITLLKRKLPECCPMCKTLLNLQPMIAKELMALSETAVAPAPPLETDEPGAD